MPMMLTSSYSAVAENRRSSFFASGGIGTVLYSVTPGGAGGSIDSFGFYTAPAQASSSPTRAYDTIVATDGIGNTASLQILVGSPLMLFCDIIQKGMGLAPGRVFLFDQKIFEPTDYGLFIVIGILRCKPFSNISRFDMVNGVYSQSQFTNMRATLDVDIISRGPAARDLKEQVVLSLYTIYSEQQQEANGFHIGRVPPNQAFINLSDIINATHTVADASACLYRFRISVNIIYATSLISPAPYYDQFSFSPPLLLDNFVPQSGNGLRTLYSVRPVGLTDWVPLIWNLLQTTSSISIYDTSGQTMEIGICDYSAPANDEVSLFLVPSSPVPLNLDIIIPFGKRISIRAVSAPATTGENDLNITY